VSTTQDIGSSVAGGGAGFLMLNSVKWEAVMGGETTKVVVALLFILGGYLAYRSKKEEEPKP
jgi:hypothetical protein